MTFRDLRRKILHHEELGVLSLDQEITEKGLDELKEGMLTYSSANTNVPYNDSRQMNIDDYLDRKEK